MCDSEMDDFLAELFPFSSSSDWCVFSLSDYPCLKPLRKRRQGNQDQVLST